MSPAGHVPGASRDAGDTVGKEDWEKASNSSSASKSSLGSMVSRVSSASSALRRGLSMPSRKKADSDKLRAGDTCETVARVTARKEESIVSAVVCELQPGTMLWVLQVGEKDRLEVTTKAGSLQGWISSRTQLNEPLVVKKGRDVDFVLRDFKVDGKFQVLFPLTVRVSEDRDSEAKAVLKPGAQATIMEIGMSDKSRAKVHGKGKADVPGVDGWITLLSKHGDPTLGKITSHSKEVDIEFMPKYMKIKSLLHASVKGDLPGMKKMLEGGFMMSRSKRPDVNCTDARGKTALMFAAACGHKAIVEYLLNYRKPDSWVEVNAADNTQKTALHHAATRAKRTTGAQQEIVSMLLGKSASMEARDHNGCTPLMFAIANGAEDTVRILLSAKANVNIADFEGRMPLDYATTFKQESLQKLLSDHGARQSVPEPRAVERREEKDEGAATLVAPEQEEQTTSAGMKEAVETHEQAKEITVAERDDDEEEEGNSEVDQKAAELAKLSALVSSDASESELQAAIKVAQAAGATDTELAAAEKRLKELQIRASAVEKLNKAIASRNVGKLKVAIANAQDNQVPSGAGSTLEAAKKVLAEEEPKQEARDRLQAAQDAGDTEKLKSAIKKAEKVGLAKAEVAKFQELLAGAESKEKAEEMLKAAMKKKDIHDLKFAIQQAKDAGADAQLIKDAKAVLKDEEPKVKARELLAAAKESGSLPALRDAIEKAKAAGLAKEEYRGASDLLKKKEEQEKQLAAVTEAVQETKKVDMTSIDSLREVKDKLSAVISDALKAGVPEADLKDAEARRKKLHNAIEDLKGSIRVFCRVRPLSTKEKNAGDTTVTKALDGLTLELQDNGKFQFDAVFTPGTQEEVFEDCRDLVQSAVDGYNVTMFAYGQTGAGKTFTMYGAPGMEGTAPRTIREVFKVTEEGKGRFTYTVMASMLELYRNDLVDLLTKGNPTASKGKLSVRNDKSGAVVIENLTEEVCSNYDDLSNLLDRGNAQRAVAATEMNSESSRSHLVLIIKIVSVNKETKEKLTGKILLCDLAGSERIAKSGVVGDGAKEAIEINKSLTALGDVIEGLTQKVKVVPYRNHKLTQLMQDSLGGTAKTLMFVNCSPAASNTDETLMSLKYATRAKKIENKVEKQGNSKGEKDKGKSYKL